MKFQLFLCALGLTTSLALGADAPPQKTELLAEDLVMKTVGNETRVLATRSKGEPVTLIGTNLKIICDRLEVVALGVGDKTSVAPVLERFKYLLATGHVQIVQGEREAICGRAEVFPLEAKPRVVLTENPHVIDHGGDTKVEEDVTVNGRVEKRARIDHSHHWEQSGEEITMYRGEREVHIRKGRTIGPEIKDLGFDKDQPAPKADAKAESKK